jgi:internalin A
MCLIPVLENHIPDPERQRERWPAQHLPEHTDAKAIFISYAWSGESENIANQVDHAFNEKGVTIIRDQREIGFKDRIKDFMERIGRGKCVIVIISEKYLKSENCMFELLQIAKHPQFVDRIFPIVLDDAKIYKPIDRIKYVKHWEEEIKKLDQEIKSVSAANLQGFREDIDFYTKIRESVSDLTNVLKDMNTLTVQIHKESGFEALFKAIEHKLST